MRRRLPPRFSFLVAVLACLLPGAGSGLLAQQSPEQGAAPQAPVVQFPAEGVSLEEAVRLTLEHDPVIHRAQADTLFRGGVAQEQSGLFDVTFTGTASYSRRFQELTRSAKEEQQKKRDELQSLIDAGPAQIAQAREARDLLERIRLGEVSTEELTTVSPTLAATLLTLDELIATSPDDLAEQLRATREQVLTDALRIADAELDIQERILASAEEELRNIGPAPRDEYFTDATLSMELSKMFRSGIVISPFFDGTYSSTGFRGKPHDVRFGGKGLTDLYEFRAGLNALLPLGRGRGAEAVAAPERAARIEHEGSLLALEHERAAAVFNTARAYWNARAAQENAAIAQDSLTFQQQLVGLIQALVNAGDMAGVERSRAEAAQARALADVDDARRRLRDARVDLAIAMGIGAGADESTLPMASDPFPQVPVVSALAPGLLDQALDRRQDFVAATRFEEAGRVLARGARLDLRPLFDLNVGTWYTALDEGSGKNALDRWVGPSGSVAFQFEKPLGNNLLEGRLAQREADARLRAIDQADIARRIQLRVLQSTGTLQESVTQVEQAQEAVGHYQTTIDAEFARLRSGDSTVIDTIVTQQQQIGARFSLVAAQLELAQRIVELRFQSGTLVSGGTVRAQDLVTVPGGGGQ